MSRKKPDVPTHIVEFGRQLIETKDLDPIYVMLHNAGLHPTQLKRWLLSYFCFYHAGTASWIVDQPNYWDAMRTAVATKDYPRGTERRHFRGGQGSKAIEALVADGRTPQQIIDDLCSTDEPDSIQEMFKKVKKLRGFGDWIAFKVADILERLGLSLLDANPNDIFLMFDSPVKGANLAYEMYDGTGDPLEWAYGLLINELGDLEAPPRDERTINIQEVETILCKWKSHTNGHYTMGVDTKELEHHLRVFDTRTARKLHSRSQGDMW